MNTLSNFYSIPKQKGFTLIELIVTIVVLGVLSGIALPSYVNQTAKARSSEGKSGIGIINRAQQAYRLENLTMSNSIHQLDVKMSGKFYSFEITFASQTFASSTAKTNTDGLKGYSGGVTQYLFEQKEFTKQIICETLLPVENGISATPPSNERSLTCAENELKIN